MNPTPLSLTFARFKRHRLALAGSFILALLFISSLAAPIVELALGTSVDSIDLLNRFSPPSLSHPMGTDELGRDTLVRLLYGGRVSLLVGLAAALSSAALGAIIGLLAGYYGGWLDKFLMRITDGVISLPLLPLLIVLAAVDPEKIGFGSGAGDDLTRIIVIVALFGWTTVARLVRGTAMSLKQRTFVITAHALGASPFRIMTRHILPNLASPIIVATTLTAGNVILLESVLSFLGLGIQPPLPSWGNLLTNAQELIWSSPALAFYPGALIFITVIAFNFLGDGLQDAMDPRSQRRN